MSDAAREPEDDEMSQIDHGSGHATEATADVEATADDAATVETTATVEAAESRSRTW